MTTLPEPLTPADCDLRDFQFMPMDVRRLLTSETWVMGTGDERAASMTLWLESWQQVPAGSIPKADRMLAHLSQAGAKWGRVKDHVLRNWVEAADGRLYHAVVAEKVLEAWIEKLANSLSGASGNAKRWGVAIDTDPIRDQFIDAVNMLKNVAPQSKTLKKKIVATIVSASPPVSPPDHDPISPPDPLGIAIDSKGTVKGPTPTPADLPPEAGEVLPAALLSMTMRRFGIQSNPGDPRLIALADQGVTVDNVTAACEQAKLAKPNEPISLGYVAAILTRLAKEARSLDVAPAAPAKKDWL